MKHKLCCVLAGIAVCVIGNADAQLIPGGFHVIKYKVTRTYPDSYIPAFSFESGHSLNNVNLKAVRVFLKRYKEEANEVTWQVSERGDYVARFSVDSVDVIAAYGKNGNWLYSIRRYSPNKLQAELRSFVMNQYSDYSIVHVDEISLPFEKNTSYIISIQNDTEYKILNVCNNRIEVQQTIEK